MMVQIYTQYFGYKNKLSQNIGYLTLISLIMEHDILDNTIKLLINSSLSNYRISLDTGISDETIANYRKGKSKPRGANLKILSEYLKGLSVPDNETNNSARSILIKPENVMSSINQRIQAIINEMFDGNKAKFAKAIDIAPTSISNYLSDKRQSKPSADMLGKIINVVEGLSAEWLLTGNGSMLKEETSAIALKADSNEKLIPLYRNEAVAGFGTADFAIRPEDIEGYYKIKEFMNADFMLHVRGDSMLPLYKPGDTIAVREIKECNFIQWGKPHLIAARYQGLLIKRLYPSEQDDTVSAVSDNKEVYPPFRIPMEDITGIALIIGTVRLDNF